MIFRFLAAEQVLCVNKPADLPGFHIDPAVALLFELKQDAVLNDLSDDFRIIAALFEDLEFPFAECMYRIHCRKAEILADHRKIVHNVLLSEQLFICTIVVLSFLVSFRLFRYILRRLGLRRDQGTRCR